MEQEPKKEPNVDPIGDWIEAHKAGSGEIEYKGKKIPFTLIRREALLALPGFLGFPDGKHLFISEEVLEEFRTPQLIHEIIEFSELKGQEGRCVEALKQELLFVPEKIRPKYLGYRRAFFARLIEFQKNSKDEGFKAEIAASYKFLQELR